MTNDPHITIADLRVLYCVKGIKKHLDAAGVDFARFIREGASASELMGHGFDAQIDRAVEMIQARDTGDGR
ncbi:MULTISPECIES: hypothetical protein [unclassified Mesorhizobium]|uniref:hypothetical protein n=1 Tax=unclassified Mesorhizobium TaxID=325217 RepID=UPI0010935394|nr:MULTISPECIES: hypothetical protein [unclassified Mesorhizobium]TGT90914.1 hypothetical protein EN804_06150 [Mesorhizobium sp. M8A.F.Ca.ET.161.01.1.1]TGV43806.1 hypothetical protein EN785_07395 [Mesorhizobium sp. M8A.F.Ca.ET.142.01.1.1]